MAKQLLNYINGAWCRSGAREHLDIMNPATAEVIAALPLSATAEVGGAVRAAARRFRYQAQVGIIGINVGVAAPMAFF